MRDIWIVKTIRMFEIFQTAVVKTRLVYFTCGPSIYIWQRRIEFMNVMNG